MGSAIGSNIATKARTTLKATARADDCAISLVDRSATTGVLMTAVQVKYVGGCGKRECGSQMLKPHGTHGCCNANVTMKLQTTIKHYGWEIVT